jgi:hypothetical protein
MAEISAGRAKPRCDDYIIARMPAALRRAVKQASANKISEYTRRALLAQLLADGVENAASDEAA